MSGTANRKIVRVGKQMGMPNIAEQQGTTRIIYDALPLQSSGVSQTLQFFQNVNNRKFPFTNLNQNKLNKGETLSLQYFSFQILSCAAGTDRVLNIFPLDNIAGGTQALYRSDLSILIAEDTVVKKLPLQSMYAPFNKDAKFYGQVLVNPGVPALEANLGFPHDAFRFVNPIIIPQDLEFVMPLQLPAFTGAFDPAADFYLMMTMEGLGTLFSPKTTY
jgi:hypothetical protein